MNDDDDGIMALLRCLQHFGIPVDFLHVYCHLQRHPFFQEELYVCRMIACSGYVCIFSLTSPHLDRSRSEYILSPLFYILYSIIYILLYHISYMDARRLYYGRI